MSGDIQPIVNGFVGAIAIYVAIQFAIWMWFVVACWYDDWTTRRGSVHHIESQRKRREKDK
jgi:hypothetical protein